MPKVVVVGGRVECGHQGQAVLTSGNGKFTIGGMAVVTAGDEVGLSFTPSGAPPTPTHPVPCTFFSGSNPQPCSATQPAVVGVSTKILVGGLGVLLENAEGIATNTPPSSWSVADAGQSAVEAGS
jgi:hypothetical protein